MSYSHLRVTLALLSALLAAHTLCAAPENNVYTFTVWYTKEGIWTQSEDRHQACCPDYKAAMEKAAEKDEKALERIFYISTHSEWDGAGGEFHTSYMRRLLLLWGDVDFARVLALQPAETRRKILRTLNLGGQDRFFPELFPHTAAGRPHIKPRARANR